MMDSDRRRHHQELKSAPAPGVASRPAPVRRGNTTASGSTSATNAARGSRSAPVGSVADRQAPSATPASHVLDNGRRSTGHMDSMSGLRRSAHARTAEDGPPSPEGRNPQNRKPVVDHCSEAGSGLPAAECGPPVEAAKRRAGNYVSSEKGEGTREKAAARGRVFPVPSPF